MDSIPVRSAVPAEELASRLGTRDAAGIGRALARLIHDGTLAEDSRLPTVRALSSALRVSPTTVSEAWQRLLGLGLIETRGRAGTVVRAVPAPASTSRFGQLSSRRQGMLDLSTGTPDPTMLPCLRPAMRATPGDARISSYFEAPVLPELEALLRADWPYSPAQLTIVDGSMDGIDRVIAETVRYGDHVLVENPTFPPVLDLLELAGATAVGLPLDEEGIRVEDLRAAVEAFPVRALVLQPRAQNPTGVAMTPRRAADIARLLPPAVLVVEDDHSAALSVAPAVSIGSHLPEQTVHIRGFSKSMGPDLRLAAMAGPADVLTPVMRRRMLGPAWSSRLLQTLLSRLLTDAESIAEVDIARTTYADRRHEWVDALRARGVEVRGSDGFNLWIPVADEAAAMVHLAGHGVVVAPGAPFMCGPGRVAHLRVTCAVPVEDVSALAGLIGEAARTDGGSLRPPV